jgi:S1-C subfamily serine protease
MIEKTLRGSSRLVVLNWLLIGTCLLLAAVCVRFLMRESAAADRGAHIFKDQAFTTEDGAKKPAGDRLPPQEPRLITVEEKSIRDLFKSASPGVVHITTEAVRRDFFNLDLMKIPKGSGTGFLWDEHGHVVTNYHVIRDADLARVALADHSSWSAKLVGAAPDKDLAVLKIDAPAARLHPIPVGRSKDLEVGLKVFAIGNPFGLDQTLTTGIISALGREIESVTQRTIRDVIQTDAAINPGNSGGPLLDSQGNLIGVNTAIYSPSGAYAGIGFAIPVDTVARVVPQLIEHGKLIRPGLRIDTAPDSLAKRLRLPGILVLNVDEGSTAESVGLQPTRRSRTGEILLGDVITGIDGVSVKTGDELLSACEERAIGETVSLSVWRAGRTLALDVKLEATE